MKYSGYADRLKNAASTAGVACAVSVFLFIFAFSAISSASEAKSAYDEYMKSYAALKSAIEKGGDETSIKTLSESYKSAMDRYKAALAKEKGTADPTAASQTSSARGESAAPSNSGAAEKPVEPVAKSMGASACSVSAGREIERLSNVVASIGPGNERAKAKIELAALVSKFRNDQEKAIALLKEAQAEALEPKTREGAKSALEAAIYLAEKESLFTGVAARRAEARQAKLENAKISWKNPLKKIAAVFADFRAGAAYHDSITGYKKYVARREKATGYAGSNGLIAEVAGFDYSPGVDEIYARLAGDEKAFGKVRLMTENVEAWHARWNVISGAKDTLDIVYFIVGPDAFGKSFLGLLRKKAREGVKIRLLLDSHGSKYYIEKDGLNYLMTLAAEPGVSVRVYNPMRFGTLEKALFENVRNIIASNHQKIIVADGSLSITGGRNLANHYFADPKDEPAAFRDTDVMIEGPRVAAQMTEAFDEEFGLFENVTIAPKPGQKFTDRGGELDSAAKSMGMWINGEGLHDDPSISDVNEELMKNPGLAKYKSFERGANAFHAGVKVLGKHGFRQEKDEITDALVALIDAATSEIVVQNPFFILTEKAAAAFSRAGKRGVRIIVYTNGPKSHSTSDGKDMLLFIQAVFMDEWKNFLKEVPSARIFGIAIKKKVHAKVFVFDRRISVVGTYNLDYVSQDINSEDVCVIDSPAFAAECRDKIFDDFKIAVEYKIGRRENGEIYVINGPESLLSPDKVRAFELLKNIKILRPLL